MSWKKYFGIKEKVEVPPATTVEQLKHPEVELKGIVFDPAKGIKIDLDWNEGFVVYLKQHGFTGADDDTIVQKWLAALTKQIAKDMEEDRTLEDAKYFE